jgi:hypothetical protein
MTDDLTSAAHRFWIPGAGATRQGFISASPRLRAQFARDLLEDAARFDWIAPWTNSRELYGDPRVTRRGDATVLLRQLEELLAARREAGARLFMPTGADPIPLLILDGDTVMASTENVALTGHVVSGGPHLGVALALIVPAPVSTLATERTLRECETWARNLSWTCAGPVPVP